MYDGVEKCACVAERISVVGKFPFLQCNEFDQANVCDCTNGARKENVESCYLIFFLSLIIFMRINR